MLQVVVRHVNYYYSFGSCPLVERAQRGAVLASHTVLAVFGVEIRGIDMTM
jgi:hypothetical protein